MRAFPPPSSGTARLVSREAAVGCNSLDGRSLLLDPCVSPAGVEDPATSTNLDKSIGRPDADVYLRCADCVLCLHQAAKRMRSTQVGLSRGTSAGYSEICRSAQQTLSVVPMYVRDPTDGRARRERDETDGSTYLDSLMYVDFSAYPVYRPYRATASFSHPLSLSCFLAVGALVGRATPTCTMCTHVEMTCRVSKA